MVTWQISQYPIWGHKEIFVDIPTQNPEMPPESDKPVSVSSDQQPPQQDNSSDNENSGAHPRLTSPQDPEQRISPVPGYNVSPVRPQNPVPYRKPIVPSVPRPSRPETPVRADPTPTEEIDVSLMRQDRAASALERLREKMAVVAQEYAEGKINRVQFHVIYQRYQEQRDITERLLKRDPKTGAWRTVIQPGHTSFLREHFEAKVESFAIYHTALAKRIILTGTLQLPRQQVLPILSKLQVVARKQGSPGTAKRKLKDDRVVLFVPGVYALSVAVFSLDPAVAQVEMIQDMHRDFEQANRQVLEHQIFDPREMVFPHRALFEK